MKQIKCIHKVFQKPKQSAKQCEVWFPSISDNSKAKEKNTKQLQC